QVPRALPLRHVGGTALPQPVLGDHATDLGRAPEQPLLSCRGCHRKNRRRFCAFSSTRCIVLTITTVRRVPCETRFGTLPSRNSLRPLMPTFPTTTTSTSSLSAASMIAFPGSSPTTTVPNPLSPASSCAWRTRSSVIATLVVAGGTTT